MRAFDVEVILDVGDLRILRVQFAQRVVLHVLQLLRL
jgi:hypothetical protein